MIGIGVVGYGYWGPNLTRNFAEIPDARLMAVCDARPDRLAQARQRHPGLETTTDYRDLLNDVRIDAIVIATPVASHFDLAWQALRAGKHVLIEKPMTTSSEEAKRLIAEATRRQRILMVDHTFVFSGAVAKVKELVAGRMLGDIYYYDAVRVNLGLFRHDVNVLWDLAVHDLSIITYVLPDRPRAVSATGMSHVPGEPENIAYLTLFFDSNLIAHVHANWLAPVKVRQTLIGGSEKMIVYDDIEPSEKIKVYDKGITLNQNGHDDSVHKLLVGYRTGDMWAPQLDGTEALRKEALHFLRCITENRQPLIGGEEGLQIVQLLEAASRSMAAQGRLIEMKSEVAA